VVVSKAAYATSRHQIFNPLTSFRFIFSLLWTGRILRVDESVLMLDLARGKINRFALVVRVLSVLRPSGGVNAIQIRGFN